MSSVFEEILMSTHSLYQFFSTDGNEIDWYIAYDLQDAQTLWENNCGESLDDYPEIIIRQLNDDDLFEINYKRATVREWLSVEPRGYLCSNYE